MHNESTFVCHTCGKNYTSLEYLQRHKRRFHDKSAKSMTTSLKCDFCDIVFTMKKSLDKHLNTVHFQSGDKYKCEICEKIFSDKTFFKMHFNNIHAGQTLFGLSSVQSA